MAKESKKKNEVKSKVLLFPKNLLSPVGKFLKARLELLEKRRKDIDSEDPFKDFSRTTDNASPDTDAAEQFGHAKSSAIKKELDIKIKQTKKAIKKVKKGDYGICEDCGEMIDTDRLMIYPEATLCAKDQAKRE